MTVINTYNETHLHRTLKKIYALEFNGQTEQKSGSYIFDIVTEDKNVIEIQTSNISALKNKIKYVLKKGRKITVVHPVIEQKIIKTYSADGTACTERKSPKKESVYSVLRSLTGIYNLLTAPGFTLELVFISLTEIRQKTEEKVQTKNKARRHLRDWLVADKHLAEINSKKIFRTKEDYKTFLPAALPREFTPPQLQALFTEQKEKEGAKYHKLLIWLLEKMGIIKNTGKKQGRSWLYSVCKN